MAMQEKKEVWLRGALPGITPALQPAAHALLQAREELDELMKDFPERILWEQPAGVASAGFHLQHMTGVLERLFTYAAGKPLTNEQLKQLAAEGVMVPVQAATMVKQFNEQVEKSLQLLKNIPAEDLFQPRGVGRAQIPSTVLGLLVHAAEHTMRHLGQLLVTVRIVKAATPKL